MRIGLGYDVHRLISGRPLVLGGIVVPSDRGLEGHSDADALLHAVCDALLGAAALGDLGAHFPDTDDRWRGAHSRDLLLAVTSMLAEHGFCVVNVDATIAMERPKVRPLIDAMRQSIAGILNLTVGQVSVKATTGEGMGFVGRQEGVAVWAVCQIEAE